jgi:multicomponent Na+:H+ antiporter subunit F
VGEAAIVNAWLIAATVLIVAIAPCLWVCVRGEPLDALVALEVASTITTLVLLLVAQGYRRDPFMDLALVSAVLSFVGALAFVRFLERWV